MRNISFFHTFDICNMCCDMLIRYNDNIILEMQVRTNPQTVSFRKKHKKTGKSEGGAGLRTEIDVSTHSSLG